MLPIVLFFGSFGYLFIRKWQTFKSKPLIFGKGDHVLTINIPEIWLPWKTGDTENSITEQYKPNISIESGEWLIQFRPIPLKVHGVTMEYSPKALRTPLLPDMDTLLLAMRMAPKVKPTITPLGWNIKFPEFIVLT